MGYTIWPDGPTGEMVELVYRERQRQEALRIGGKFLATCATTGSAAMNDAECFAVLGEEFGEVAREVTEAISRRTTVDREKLRDELIQVAAVAVAWAERLS